MDEAFKSIFAYVVSTLTGLATAALIEWIKKPKLRLSWRPSEDSFSSSDWRVRAVSILVENEALGGFRGFLMTRQPALQCFGRIEFLDFAGNPLFQDPMDARWTGSHQPTEMIRDGRLSPVDVAALKHRDIYPGFSEGLDIAVKDYKSETAWGFSNESYLIVSRGVVSPRPLPPEIVFVKVSVFCCGDTVTKTFKLRADLPAADFELEKGWEPS